MPDQGQTSSEDAVEKKVRIIPAVYPDRVILLNYFKSTDGQDPGEIFIVEINKMLGANTLPAVKAVFFPLPDCRSERRIGYQDQQDSIFIQQLITFTENFKWIYEMLQNMLHKHKVKVLPRPQQFIKGLSFCV
jgi:hypothetical protein